MEAILEHFTNKYSSQIITVEQLRIDLKAIINWDDKKIDQLLDASCLSDDGRINASHFVHWVFDKQFNAKEHRRKVAVYGGAFDPPTIAHLTMAAQIIQGGSADEVWMVPSGPRPDKPSLKTRAVDRYVMCQLSVNVCFSREFPIRVSDLEVGLDEALATYDLLCKLRDAHPNLDFSFVIGSDWLQEGSNMSEWTSRNWSWKHGDSEESRTIVTGHKMLTEFDFLVVNRPGYDVPAKPEDPTGLRAFGPRLRWIKMPEGVTFVEGNLSSSEIRARARNEVHVRKALAEEESKRSLFYVEGLVPRIVLGFMLRENLYASPSLANTPMGKRRRVAVYGGAFDPITNSHLMCAGEIVHSGCADQVWLVPCGPRPDKPKLKTKPLDRFCMCNIAVNFAFSSSFPIKVSNVECFAEEALATYDLLCSLRERHKEFEFMFVIGSDWLQPGSSLADWESKNWDWTPGDPENKKTIVTGHKMLEEFDFLVIKRPGYDLPTSPSDPTGLKQFGPRLSWLTMPEKMTFIEGNLSSTELRRRSAAELRWGLEGLTANAVIAYIYRQNLYDGV
eukprot:TRINITY_DN49388_c0_g1_i1.p1 TRINITY_DN49388_c0_g1~~TRINITY_DN49388_c0_g1_i1.p1  ORF type:complete len:605 (+),score=74.38 TRINITY_DN49388_c0_g1_i1:134-1816(+)